ncbi:MAG: YdhR family protein [Ottowia sp.]|jgi:hypothetical protein|uniref:monooxygenase n=1 Tax=Ottowia beijingensis TaxID=1207057 RepID=UPI001B594DE1|nr:YdhR family protein [Ottowia sp.]MBP9952985.1 YdhR family protein [Ottowia sp.]
MITALVQFKLPERMTVEQARAVFASTAPRYLAMQGLVRKHYILSEDGLTAGGVYLWQTRADAERVYDAAWREFIRGKYHTDPVVTYFDTPVMVDNVAGQVVESA